MRAAIYNPYLDTLGGGERYSLAFALALSEAGYKVDVAWKSASIKKRLEDRFGLDLSGVNFIRDIKKGDGYDVCFWVSDGSIPLLRARKNFLHFQVPFQNVNGKTLLNKMKLFRIEKIICNSHFTKKFIDSEYGVDSLVIYPPVSVAKMKPKRKKNWILFVGRFSQLTQAKNQHILVRNFKKLYRTFPDWELVLAGGTEVGAKDYLHKLEREIEGFPIKIIKSPTFKEIVDLYGQSKIFWSAVGFGAKEEKEPQKVEHFGITLVEAMAAKVAPVVFSAGGYKEIVTDGKDGFLWKSEGELLKKTKILIEDKVKYNALVENASVSSQKYDYERFKSDVGKIL